MALLRLFSITKNSFSILSRDSTDPYSLFSSSEVSAFLLHPLPIFVFVSAPFFTSFCSFSNLLASLSDPSRFSTGPQVPSGQPLHHTTRYAATSPTILLSRINSTSYSALTFLLVSTCSTLLTACPFTFSCTPKTHDPQVRKVGRLPHSAPSLKLCRLLCDGKYHPLSTGQLSSSFFVE